MRFLALLSIPVSAFAQGTAADYGRAETLRQRLDSLVIDVAEPVTWYGGTKLWYRKSVKRGNVFMTADAAAATKQSAFDHAAAAASLSAALGRPVSATNLPFTTIGMRPDGKEFEVTIDSARFTCTVPEGKCARADATAGGRGGRGGRGGGGGGARFGGGLYGGDPAANAPNTPRVSPDGKWEASARNFNVFIRAAGTTEWAPLSTDGNVGNAYDIRSFSWSPDSRKLAAYRVKPGFKREVHYVQSSPEDQIQPKDVSRLYNKPGDVLDVDQPVVGSSRVDLQACKLEYSIVSPK